MANELLLSISQIIQSRYEITAFALSGFVRAQGDADSGIDRLWQKKKVELGQ